MTDKKKHQLSALVARATDDPETERQLVEMEDAAGSITFTAHPSGVMLHAWVDPGIEAHQWVDLGPGWDGRVATEGHLTAGNGLAEAPTVDEIGDLR